MDHSEIHKIKNKHLFEKAKELYNKSIEKPLDIEHTIVLLNNEDEICIKKIGKNLELLVKELDLSEKTNSENSEGFLNNEHLKEYIKNLKEYIKNNIKYAGLCEIQILGYGLICDDKKIGYIFYKISE
jgi:hypothetical protein